MPPLGRILEISLYSILNFFPFILLALCPFRRQLRFTKTATVLMVVLLGAIQIFLRSMAVFGQGDKGMLTTAATVVYGAFYFAVIKASFGKTLFTLFMLSNVADLIVTDSKRIEGLIFGKEMAAQSYRWTASVSMLLVSLVILIPLFLYFYKYYSDGISKQAGASSWNYLWLIPATFYLLWYWHCYGSVKTALEIALEPSSALLTLFINLGAFLVYHTVVRLINEQERSSELAAQNHRPAIQSLQYENLSKQIAATRQARHDIRHHITIVDGYLNSGEYEKLHDYLQSYKKSMPDDTAVLFCGHRTVNILLLHFAQ